MSAPNLQYPPAAGGGTPVGGSGTPGTIPVWSSGTTLTDSAVTQTNGVILSVTLTSGGTGYTNGSYPQVALTNVTGTGTGATADIFVAGGIVTSCVLRNPGSGYVVGSQLSCALTGSGFVVTIATVGSSAQASGNVSAPRVGAGITSPMVANDVRGATWNRRFEEISSFISTGSYARITTQNHSTTEDYPGATYTVATAVTAARSSIQRVDSSSYVGAASLFGTYQQTILTGGTASTFARSAYYQCIFANSSATAQTVALMLGCEGTSQVAQSGLLNTFTELNGVRANVTHSASSITSAVTSIGVKSAIASLNANHAITDAAGFEFAPGTLSNGTFTNWYGLRLRAATLTGATITNRFGISQEDTLAKNYLAGNTGIGTASPYTRAEINYGTLITVNGTTPNTTTSLTLSANDPGVTAGGNGVLMQMRPITNRGAVVAIGAVNGDANKDANGALTFYYNSANGQIAEGMRLNSSGYVGIGTASPSAKLEVPFTGSLAGMRIQISSANYFNATNHFFRTLGDNNLVQISGNYIDASFQANYGLRLPATPGVGDANTLDAYREGTRVLAAGDLSGWTYVTATQYWTLVGRTVTLHTVFTGGTSSATGGATIATPPLLTPLRIAAGVAVNSAGTALGNGVAVVGPTSGTTGTVTTSNAISSSAVDKVITVTYETAGL